MHFSRCLRHPNGLQGKSNKSRSQFRSTEEERLQECFSTLAFSTDCSSEMSLRTRASLSRFRHAELGFQLKSQQRSFWSRGSFSRSAFSSTPAFTVSQSSTKSLKDHELSSSACFWSYIKQLTCPHRTFSLARRRALFFFAECAAHFSTVPRQSSSVTDNSCPSRTGIAGPVFCRGPSHSDGDTRHLVKITTARQEHSSWLRRKCCSDRKTSMKLPAAGVVTHLVDTSTSVL